MKKILALLALASFVGAVQADTSVRGYTRKDGTYVQPHMRSSPDSNPYNNYSTQGNTNPYTGQAGTRNPYEYQTPSYSAPSYQAPRQQVCGYTAGGQYICR